MNPASIDDDLSTLWIGALAVAVPIQEEYLAAIEAECSLRFRFRGGGGGIHSCGNIHHLAAEYLRLPSLRSLDLGQPELNDLDSLYARARDRQVALIRVDVPEAELLSGRVRQRFPTGVTLRHRAASHAEAARLMSLYRTQ